MAPVGRKSEAHSAEATTIIRLRPPASVSRGWSDKPVRRASESGSPRESPTLLASTSTTRDSAAPVRMGRSRTSCRRQWPRKQACIETRRLPCRHGFSNQADTEYTEFARSFTKTKTYAFRAAGGGPAGRGSSIAYARRLSGSRHECLLPGFAGRSFAGMTAGTHYLGRSVVKPSR